MTREAGPTGVSVLVPRRPDGGPRDRAWQWLRPRWESLGWQVVEGSHNEGEWCKASAVTDALTHASGDILVAADADVWCPDVPAAVQAVLAGASWAVPHTLVHRLTSGATDVLYGTEVFGGPLVEQRVEQRPYPGMPGGGCVVLTRDVYGSCPLDPRFQGWGQEDQSWGIALTSLYGPPVRMPGPCWHLWHPPQERVSRSTGSMAGRRLMLEYATAAREGRMAAYLAEVHGSQARERSVTGYRYRNNNDGSEHVLDRRSPRLDRLSNWTLVEEPEPEPLREDDFRRALASGSEAPAASHPVVAAPVVAPVEVPRPVETVHLPERVETFSLPEPVAAPAVADDSDLTQPPKPYAGKLEWLAYARMRGVSGCDGMTKKELQAACGF